MCRTGRHTVFRCYLLREVGQAGLIFPVWYADVLSGGLVLAFALLVTIMLMVIGFLALAMVRTSKLGLLQLRQASVVDREEAEVGCSTLAAHP